MDSCISEITALERLKGCSHIVSMSDFCLRKREGELRWDILIRMELLKSLEEYLSETGKIDQEQAIRIGLDICDALVYCEREHIIHRDIKQENVFVSRHGDFKLGDFGIAKNLEKTRSMYSQKGTYTYMAPEIYQGRNYGSNVDIYSLGILLFRLLNNNRIPFTDPNKQMIGYEERKEALNLRMRGEQLPAPCNADAAMTEVILKACAYDPQERYQKAEELQSALLAVQDGTYQSVLRNVPGTKDVQITSESRSKSDPEQKREETSFTDHAAAHYRDASLNHDVHLRSQNMQRQGKPASDKGMIFLIVIVVVMTITVLLLTMQLYYKRSGGAEDTSESSSAVSETDINYIDDVSVTEEIPV